MKVHQPLPLAAGILSLLLPAVGHSFAQTTTATTDPVGYTALALPANSDSLISIPFTRPVAFAGAIGSVSGNTITVASTPGWTATQFVYAPGTQSNTYYAIIGPNITAVSGTVTVTNGSTAVSATAGFIGIQPGDELTVNGLAYNVASVTSDTALVLSRAYTGTGGTGLSATYDHSPKEGCYYMVTSNGTNSLTVNLNGDSLSAVTTGTSVSLIPYWTLGTAFPASAAGTSFIASTSAKARGTQILMPDLTDSGINLSASAVYFFLNGEWVSANDNFNSYNDVILPPATYFTVRNASTATTFTPVGGVYMNRVSIALDTSASTQQDNAVAVARPTAFTLNDLGLISSGAFTPSVSTKARADQLFVYDNTVVGINKSAAAIYYYYGGAWRSANDSSSDYGNTPIPYGVGLTIRKAVTANGTTSFWQNTRNY